MLTIMISNGLISLERVTEALTGVELMPYLPNAASVTLIWVGVRWCDECTDTHHRFLIVVFFNVTCLTDQCWTACPSSSVPGLVTMCHLDISWVTDVKLNMLLHRDRDVFWHVMSYYVFASLLLYLNWTITLLHWDPPSILEPNIIPFCSQQFRTCTIKKNTGFINGKCCQTINHIQNKSFCLHNIAMCVYCVYQYTYW